MNRKHPLCRCEVCPLKDDPYVPSETYDGALFAVIGDHPRDEDAREGRPFLGQGGNKITSEFARYGVRRQNVHWTNVVSCKPHDFLDRIEAKVRKENRKRERENKQRKKDGEELLPRVPTPQEACSERLRYELEPFDKMIPCGTMASKATIHKSASVMDLRGAPMTVEKGNRTLKFVPSFHPDFVTKALRWSSTFANDIKRASRWFLGTPLKWKPPEILYNPQPYELEQFLFQGGVECWAYDVETDGIECLTANLRCIAIGTPKAVVVISYLSVDGHSTFYHPTILEQINALLKRFFEDETILKSGHNAGYYDKIVMREQLGINVKPCMDTMLLHRLVASELPHTLGYCGSIYTEAPSWKTDRNGKKKAYGSETDWELHEYCAYDVAVTAAILPPLWEETNRRQQGELVTCDHALQSICADMHIVGMFADQDKRKEYEVKLLREIATRRDHIRTMSGYEQLNPASVKQLRELLYEDWKLDPPVEAKFLITQTGDPSTSDHILRACLTLKTLSEDQREVLTNIRHYRKAQKLLGTYVTKLRPSTMNAWGGWDDEDSWLEKEWREKYGQKKLGIVNPTTGRFYAGYNAHITTSGRLSSSKPINAQNFPSGLRSMVCAQKGHILVGADMDQLELRLAASRWKSQKYLQAFADGLDPHSSVTAYAVFGKMFEDAAIECGCGPYPWKTGTKFKGKAKTLRNLAKTVQYASQYAATVQTVHRVITQTETDNGDGTTSLPYISMSVKQVRLMHEKWCEGAQFDKGWEMEMNTYRSKRYLTEPVMGRRRDFLDGENINEIVNFPIQAAGASLMNIAIIELADRIPLHKWGVGTGIINQCHDSIVVECPIDQAEWVRTQIEEVLNMTHRAFADVPLTAEADIAHRWNEV